MKGKRYLLFAVALFLFGCGGGGGGESPSGASASSGPEIVNTYPADKAVNVATNFTIQMEFDRDMDPFAVTAANIKVTQGGNVVAGELSLFDGNIIIFKPSSNYVASQKVAVTLTTDVKSLAGEKLAAEYSWLFTTGVSADTAGPNIADVSPELEATDVETKSEVVVTFNEPIDITSVDQATIILENKDATTAFGQKYEVAGVVSVVSSNSVKFVPTGALTIKSHFEATITGVKDMSGNEMVETVWSFTTVSPTGSEVYYLTPASAIFYALDGGTRATYDRSTGTVTVNVSDNKTYYNVSLRWTPIKIEAGKSYSLSLTCSSSPSSQIAVELKQNGEPYSTYVSQKVSCNGQVVVGLVPSESNLAGRFNINFGAATGTYTVSRIILQKLN